MIRDVVDLEVYKESLRLLKKLYEFLKKIPKSEYDSIIQCKKCGKSKELAVEYKVLSKRINKLHSIWKSGSF